MIKKVVLGTLALAALAIGYGLWEIDRTLSNIDFDEGWEM